jgi:hypothetical protein
MNPVSILQLILSLEPLALPVIQDIIALFKAKPALTSDQLVMLVQIAASIHATNAETLATIAADQAAHPLT